MDHFFVRSEVASAVKGLSVIMVDFVEEDLFGIIEGVDSGCFGL